MRKLSNITETYWSRMNRRSQGTLARKEDSVDLMDIDGFYDYLNKIYGTNPPSKILKYNKLNFILVPLFGINKAPLPPKRLGVELDYTNDGQYISISDIITIYFPTIEEHLRNTFHIEDIPMSEKRDKYLKVLPKDGKPASNTFFIKVIDFLLSEAGDKYTIILFKK
jgi:hypothetical protein